MMKLSDYVVDFIARQGVKHAMVVSGGASIHLLHSLHSHSDIDYVCPHHEQAGAMAADGYARASGGLGCAIATSGPGATNMITGIAGAWFDSVPCLFITGQVTTFRMKGDMGIRQFGFQETDLLPMVDPITKYSVQIRDAMDIRRELEKAVRIAREGRPGPVLVDIPDDLQRAMVDPDALEGEICPTLENPATMDQSVLNSINDMLAEAERPVVILGWGVQLAGAADAARDLADLLDIPVLTSWAARDIAADLEQFSGTFGTHGTRYGNFTVQNADLVISIGARLSTRETGSPVTSWARDAKTVIVDIDKSELDKFARFGKSIDLAICADAGKFIPAFRNALVDRVNKADTVSDWWRRVRSWKEAYPSIPVEAETEPEINPYAFMAALSQEMLEDGHIFSDTGCTIAWLMQAFEPKYGQRLYHDFNNTAMGWALPAAVGGCLALGRAPVLCISGDGSFMMNVQELATIARLSLPVKVMVLNNSGYAMVRQTETQWLGGVNAGTSVDSGLGFPDFAALARSFDLPAFSLAASKDSKEVLAAFLKTEGPAFLEVVIPQHHNVQPQSKFGYPIEDAEPLLPRDEFMSNMIVAPLPKSCEPLID